jgi:biopolymer transport protein ExbD
MKLKRRSAKKGRVEIIPMIDTILILLIFYMSFSTFTQKEKRIDAKLPLISTKVAPTKVPLDITIHVHDKDQIIVNGSAAFDLVSLRDAMTQLSTIGQEATVVIEAEPTTPYGDVVGALDACALARLTKVAFRPLDETKLASAQ